MPYEDVFEPDPLDEEALISGLGGAPAQPDYGPSLPTQPTPEELAWIKRMLAATEPKPGTMGARPRPSAPSASSAPYAAPATMPAPPPRAPAAQMRAATPEERVVGRLEEDDPLNAELVRAQFARTPNAPETSRTSMRAATMGERVGDQVGDLLNKLTPAFMQTDHATTPEPFHTTLDPTMGSAAPEAMATKVTKKAAAAAERAILEKLFPELDAYAKKKGALKGDAILAALQGVPDVSPATLARAEKLAAKGAKMKPAEVVDVLSGVKHDRGRVLRDVKKNKLPKKSLPGAPLWVHNEATEQEALENYLDLLEEGVAGRDFYRASGKEIYRVTGENAPLAHKLGVAASATSPTTSVGANTGFMLKGHGQGIAGNPVKTGRFPGNMSKPIQSAYDAANVEYLGPKRDPFAKQIAMGGDYATEAEMTDRAVHDIWEGEAFQFIEPDGTPLRRGFSPAEHAWMDKMNARAIEEANKRQIGGFTDWDAGTSQAATWTGAKIRAGDIKPGDAAKSFADYIPRNIMQMGRESMPGKTSQHLPELATASPQVQQMYDDAVQAITLDPQGRDVAALMQDILSSGSFKGPGIYKGDVSLGHQVENLVGTQGSGATKMVEPSSMGMARANEAGYGLVGAQDAIAGTMLNADALAGQRDMFDLVLPGGTFKANDPIHAHPAMQQALAKDQIALIPTRTGARIKNIQMPEAEFVELGKQLTKDVPQGGAIHGKDMGFYESFDWSKPEGAVGQGYARIIRDEVPGGVAGFNKSQPAIAQARHDLDQMMRDTHGMTLNDTLQEVRLAIAKNGFDGINEVATKYGLPLAMLLLILRSEEEPVPPESPS